jgi:hypothetical protein
MLPPPEEMDDRLLEMVQQILEEDVSDDLWMWYFNNIKPKPVDNRLPQRKPREERN